MIELRSFTNRSRDLPLTRLIHFVILDWAGVADEPMCGFRINETKSICLSAAEWNEGIGCLAGMKWRHAANYRSANE